MSAGDEPQRHDRCANDACRCAHQNADHDDADRHAAAQTSGQMRNHVHQLIGYP